MEFLKKYGYLTSFIAAAFMLIAGLRTDDNRVFNLSLAVTHLVLGFILLSVSRQKA